MKRQVALITGANGFIGSNLAKKLIDKNFTVHAIVRDSSKTNRLKKNKNIQIHVNNLSSVKPLKQLLTKIKPDFIFHLATYENYRDESRVDKMIKTNIIGTVNLLLAANEVSFKLFINTGSSSEYGRKSKPMNEMDILQPESAYAATKASATHFAQSFARSNKKPIITFRLFSVFGPHEAKDRLIPTLISSAIQNKPIRLTSGIVRRDFIFIDDVVDAFLAATKKKITPGQIYNIGSGKQFSNQEIVKLLEKIVKKKINISRENFPNRSWDTKYWVANITKAKKSLGWTPKNSLASGLKKTYTHIKNNLQDYV